MTHPGFCEAEFLEYPIPPWQGWITVCSSSWGRDWSQSLLLLLLLEHPITDKVQRTNDLCMRACMVETPCTYMLGFLYICVCCVGLDVSGECSLSSLWKLHAHFLTFRNIFIGYYPFKTQTVRCNWSEDEGSVGMFQNSSLARCCGRVATWRCSRTYVGLTTFPYRYFI